MFTPQKFIANPKRFPQYENVNKPLLREIPNQCSEDCACGEHTCPCTVNLTTCDASCRCSSCPRRFPPCKCQDHCDTTTCGCYLLGRDCFDGCTCKACRNRYDACKLPPLSKKNSKIAGEGLFARYDIMGRMMLGEYTGKLVHDDTPASTNHVRRMRYSKGACREASQAT